MTFDEFGKFVGEINLTENSRILSGDQYLNRKSVFMPWFPPVLFHTTRIVSAFEQLEPCPRAIFFSVSITAAFESAEYGAVIGDWLELLSSFCGCSDGVIDKIRGFGDVLG